MNNGVGIDYGSRGGVLGGEGQKRKNEDNCNRINNNKKEMQTTGPYSRPTKSETAF